MNPIAHKACRLALAALLTAGCGGRATATNDAGAQRDAGQQDVAPVDAGPRVRDVCRYAGLEAMPVDPHHPYAYECKDEMSDPDCLQSGIVEHDAYFDGGVGWFYDCKTPP